MMKTDEWLPLVDLNGKTTGKARRSEVHGNPRLMHPVVHCLVFNQAGSLLLQLRGLSKDVQPGRWDTSVGGHIGLEESPVVALVREVHEELGISVLAEEFSFLYRYVMRSSIETELVHTYVMNHEGPFVLEPNEIAELRFWSPREIEAALGTSIFTPNFEEEYARSCAVLR